MAHLEADTIAQRAVHLGLVTREQMAEGLEAIGLRNGAGEILVRALERKGMLTGWQSQKLLKGDTEGYFLGGYRILYKIASGSFGRVYRAEDPRSGLVVAIKVLRNRWTEDQKNIELFEREGKVGMAMQHPNIVEILSVNCDEANKQFYLVMEFVEGGNLRDFLKIRQLLEPLETLRILEDAAAGLAHAYSHGISHRDMKLTNVLISSSGSAKLVDFGLAGLSQNLHDDKMKVDRTVDYAGLEKATGVTQGDIRSDIYFLGCVAYELLSGRSPLAKSKNQYERMRRQRFESVRSLSDCYASGPPAVLHLVEKMMSLDPMQRYQTPAQLLDAVRTVRMDLDGTFKSKSDSAGKALFIVESDPNLQDGLRDRFKQMGFRVFMSAEPSRALERYRQQPFDGLIVDAGTVGEDGILYFDRILKESEDFDRPCAGVVILAKSQRDWQVKVRARSNTAVVMRPVSVKELLKELNKLLARIDDKNASPE